MPAGTRKLSAGVALNRSPRGAAPKKRQKGSAMGRRIDTVACVMLLGLAAVAGFKPAIVHAAPADPTVQSSDTAEPKTSGSKNRASAKFGVKSATGHSGEKAKNHGASLNGATSAKVVKSPATKFAVVHGASSLSARSHVAHEAEVRPSAGTRTALTKNSLALRRSRPSAATHATLTKNTLALRESRGGTHRSLAKNAAASANVKNAKVHLAMVTPDASAGRTVKAATKKPTKSSSFNKASPVRKVSAKKVKKPKHRGAHRT